MKYKPVEDFELVLPTMGREYRLACCDCGLVHDMFFAVMKKTKTFKNGTFNAITMRGSKWQVAIIPVRNNRATAAKRRCKQTA